MSGHEHMVRSGRVLKRDSLKRFLTLSISERFIVPPLLKGREQERCCLTKELFVPFPVGGFVLARKVTSIEIMFSNPNCT